jgi:hypothetical protein
MAAPKLSAKQQSQLGFLQILPPKLQRLNGVIEQMAGGKVDESLVRGMIRVLDESKAHASQLGMNGLADACSQMASTARRGGGQQVKVRGLKDNLAYIRTQLEMATKKASIPEAERPHDESPEPVK